MSAPRVQLSGAVVVDVHHELGDRPPAHGIDIPRAMAARMCAEEGGMRSA
ncbi:hypothetical protein [Streptomyces benahoarensis]|nr:hypothetical protein [Streptomyces benahoarensis]